MTRRWAVPLMVLLAGVVGQSTLVGQRPGRTAPGAPAVVLSQNAPNPFSSETRIPFVIGDSASCREAGRTWTVSLRVYNLLSQGVSAPVLVRAPDGVAVGTALDGVALPCGEYVALWDGRYAATGTPANTGIYLYRLDVGATTRVRKMILQR
jgi:hypothetical protein